MIASDDTGPERGAQTTTGRGGDNPTIAQREGEALDAVAVDACLKTRIPGLEGTPAIRQFPSGHSNLTYAISYPGRELVLRRPPFGTRPKSSHDMQREFRVMNALRPVFPKVPPTLFHTDDVSIIGSEFYVMEKVEGRLLRRTLPPEWGFGAADCRRLCTAFWDTLVELHQVDYAAIGLGDFGRPDGYAERQVLGWNARYERALTPDVPDFAGVRAWLETHLPRGPAPAALLHGDYRLDNVILGSDDPFAIRAVLDWEISALGDPRMDLANSLAYWIEADDPPALKRLAMQPSSEPGMLTRAEIVGRYAERTGHDLSGFDYFMVYGYFRLAVILQQIYYRYYHGQTRNPAFAGFRDSVEILGRHCETLAGVGPR